MSGQWDSVKEKYYLYYYSMYCLNYLFHFTVTFTVPELGSRPVGPFFGSTVLPLTPR